MQLARHGVLAGAGFAGDEDVGIGAREAPHLLDQSAHDAAVGDEPLRHQARVGEEGDEDAEDDAAGISTRSALPQRRSRS